MKNLELKNAIINNQHELFSELIADCTSEELINITRDISNQEYDNMLVYILMNQDKIMLLYHIPSEQYSVLINDYKQNVQSSNSSFDKKY